MKNVTMIGVDRETKERLHKLRGDVPMARFLRELSKNLKNPIEVRLNKIEKKLETMSAAITKLLLPDGLLNPTLYELSEEAEIENKELLQKTGSQTLKAELRDVFIRDDISDQEKREVMALIMITYRRLELLEKKDLPFKPKGEG